MRYFDCIKSHSPVARAAANATFSKFWSWSIFCVPQVGLNLTGQTDATQVLGKLISATTETEGIVSTRTSFGLRGRYRI
jgi:hypothetical protein